MKIYTRTGDDGSTGLYGGERVSKNDLRVWAYGTVDEANTALGLARAQLDDAALAEELIALQHDLFDLGADLATPLNSRYRAKVKPLEGSDVKRLERLIDHYQEELEPLVNFILPGGHSAAAALQLARAVVRRAEREVVALALRETVNESVLPYLNRLSDLLLPWLAW